MFDDEIVRLHGYTIVVNTNYKKMHNILKYFKYVVCVSILP